MGAAFDIRARNRDNLHPDPSLSMKNAGPPTAALREYETDLLTRLRI
jgi:hypothetical protein